MNATKYNIVFIPYRNRLTHLNYFLENLKPILLKYIKNLKIVIIEQDNTKEFNRGKLFNCGFKLYEDSCNYIFHHDVDLIPNINTVKNLYTIENDEIIRISVAHSSSLGGSIKMNSNIFKKINGYPNDIFGWGIEDRALYLKSKILGIKKSKVYNLTKESANITRLKHKANDCKYEDCKEIQNNYWRYENLINIPYDEIFKKNGLNDCNFELIKKIQIDSIVEKVIIKL